MNGGQFTGGVIVYFVVVGHGCDVRIVLCCARDS